MEKFFEVAYTFRSPEGDLLSDIAFVSGKNRNNAVIRLQNFINNIAYYEYRGREYMATLSVKESEKILRNVLIQTGKNGRLN